MLRTTQLDIPSQWIFKHFLNLDVDLVGQSITIKSPFNPNDKNPSFYLKYNDNFQQYFFIDYNRKIEGNAETFIKLLFNVSVNEANSIIREAYNKSDDTKVYNCETQIESRKTKIIDYKLGYWTNKNYNFWLKFGINKFILDYYNVKPLSEFVIQNINGVFTIKREILYGYFNKYGMLYKIYIPDSDFKFYYVQDFISGTCQLTYKTDYLLIMSSLKDMMSFKSLNIGNIECVAPNSETSFIRLGYINAYKVHYKKIGVLFDNDLAGINGSKSYKNYYNIEYLNLPLSKDVSDSVRDYGIEKVKEIIIPILIKHFKS
jgi:hypothetical protein